jgi:hypothetical protein
MPALHEFSDKELRENLASGELSDKKAVTARALLRRRRQERVQAWLKRHAWVGAILAAIGKRSGHRAPCSSAGIMLTQ